MSTELKKKLGFSLDGKTSPSEEKKMIEYINLKLSALGCPMHGSIEDYPVIELSQGLVQSYRAKNQHLKELLPPVDERIQSFIQSYFEKSGIEFSSRLPSKSFILDRHGLARILSLPKGKDKFESNIISSFRLEQGVLHNPKADKRTTKGVFHVAEGGLPAADDKKSVPVNVASKILELALQPTDEIMQLPFTDNQEDKAKTWVSLMLRPTICPQVEGFTEMKSMETRFFAPGNLVSNLDFVESIFGNAGDPFLPENDSALDSLHWSGHTGCVILAPHLVGLNKKELGLPNIKDATERQKRDGMCWEKEDEIYNDGGAYKITFRDTSGVVVTVITDNYFGYCKKEVKTQISFACNLFGLSEEEHAGGALVYPSYDLGEEFNYESMNTPFKHTFEENLPIIRDLIELQEGGYGIDKQYKNVYYLPAHANFDLTHLKIHWIHEGSEVSLTLLPNHSYILPSGYRVEMVKPGEGRRWRLSGTIGEGFFCHKPSTVSGGGKSEISKPLSDACVSGSVFVKDFHKDFDLVDEILNKDYTKRFKDNSKRKTPVARSILSHERSIGSVVKLLTPSSHDYSEEYNQWLNDIPPHIKELVLVVKRLYKEDWGTDWRARFNVDTIDGRPGNELRYRNQKLITNHLRVGVSSEGYWRTFSLRKDFIPAFKVSMEDDISAATVAPSENLAGKDPALTRSSNKYIQNCEYRFFQRPDDAIVRGYDKFTEKDFSNSNNIFCNYEPRTKEDAKNELDDAIRFEQYTQPLQKTIKRFYKKSEKAYYVTTALPRLVEGKPTKNPRYLQPRPDMENPRDLYLANLSTRLRRQIPSETKVLHPVKAVLGGKRNNPPEDGIRPMCCFNPIHYLELPELFMDFIASLTGKSPSTTGAGSEGALTKGPFNCLLQIHDLNDALTSYLITQHPVYITAAGYVGPHNKVDHDVSLLVPEIWSRLNAEELDPKFLIENGYFEKLEDFEHEGRTIMASRMGYRMTKRFTETILGRIFTNPTAVFSDKMLQPELQDMDIYVDSIENITDAHKWVAEQYLRDGSVDKAIPPLKALLHIMATGSYEGKTINDPEVRNLFSYDSIKDTEWYQKRLEKRKDIEENLYSRHLENLQSYQEANPCNNGIDIDSRIEFAKENLKIAKSSERISQLQGTIGSDYLLS